jgi:hypothetical protein
MTALRRLESMVSELVDDPGFGAELAREQSLFIGRAPPP